MPIPRFPGSSILPIIYWQDPVSSENAFLFTAKHGSFPSLGPKAKNCSYFWEIVLSGGASLEGTSGTSPDPSACSSTNPPSRTNQLSYLSVAAPVCMRAGYCAAKTIFTHFVPRTFWVILSISGFTFFVPCLPPAMYPQFYPIQLKAVHPPSFWRADPPSLWRTVLGKVCKIEKMNSVAKSKHINMESFQWRTINYIVSLIFLIKSTIRHPILIRLKKSLFGVTASL